MACGLCCSGQSTLQVNITNLSCSLLHQKIGLGTVSHQSWPTVSSSSTLGGVGTEGNSGVHLTRVGGHKHPATPSCNDCSPGRCCPCRGGQLAAASSTQALAPSTQCSVDVQHPQELTWPSMACLQGISRRPAHTSHSASLTPSRDLSQEQRPWHIRQC